jgi:hypothetical protein
LASLVSQAFASPVKAQAASPKPSAAPRLATIPSAAASKPNSEPASEFLNALQTSIAETLGLISSELRQGASSPGTGAHGFSSANAAANSPAAVSPAPASNAQKSWAEENPGGEKNNHAGTQSGPSVSSSSAQPGAVADKASQANPSNSNAPDQSLRKDSPATAAETADFQAALSQTAASSIPPTAGLVDAATQTISSQQTPSASGHNTEGDTPAGTPNLPQNLPPAAEAPPAAVTGPVQMAQIVSKAAQSEMRIGLSTAAFGSVEVRTVVRASDVGVLIGSERGDLRSLLANELPGIAQSLQQQNLRLNQVNFHQSFAFSNNQSSGGDSQPRSFVAKPVVASAISIAEAQGNDVGEPMEVLGTSSDAGSFSILA